MNYHILKIEGEIIRKYDRKKPRAEHLVDRAIPFKKLFIVSETGEKMGILSKEDALEIAASRGMNLVVISDNPTQPVAKILDYGRFKYDRKKKRKEAKLKQSVTNNREVRITPMIGDHDLNTKSKKAREFLMAGDRVKVSLKFRGRELARKDLGYDKQKDFFASLADIAMIQKEPTMNGTRFLDMYLILDKSKKSEGENNAKNEDKVSSDKKN